jgi:hypothetical protein
MPIDREPAVRGVKRRLGWLAAAVVSLLGCLQQGKGAYAGRARTPCDDACGAGRTCNEGYPLGPCMRIASLGGRCGNDKDCEGHLECYRNTCEPLGAAERAARDACGWDRRRPVDGEDGGADDFCKGGEPPHPWLKERLGADFSRIRYERNADLPTLRLIRRGVLLRFVSANERDGDMLAEILREAPRAFEIVVVERKCVSRDIMVLPEIDCPAYGKEVAWIRNGSIVATANRGESKRIASNTRALAAMP